MDGEVKAAVQQLVLDLLGEQPLHTDPAQGPILHPVAGRADDGNLDRAGCRQSRMRSGQMPARLLGWARASALRRVPMRTTVAMPATSRKPRPGHNLSR
jgi:hypothetical protein